ncbi:GNAT family N-acetyltransferase/peptidase C39 family protein [Marinospirillum sp.]|uniref:GNAT family N-acetyltransferase/peptidase C39 family protein n=1 Tax=Marinospirillum sp. TaxID=2183934 RepID=UPI003A8620A2
MEQQAWRSAELADLPALLALEQQAFQGDRLTRRQLRWLIQKGHAQLDLLQIKKDACWQLAGYVLLLFHRGTSLARLYSLAVAPDWQGQGLGQLLLARAETLALAEGCAMVRLEVRQDNLVALKLYQQQGYRRFAQYADYYEDHSPAWRLQKRLRKAPEGVQRHVPYYQQTLPFTCGPAALLMAMGAQQAETRLDQRHELQLWREATSIFMTSGHGGCGPRGLALAAWRRGFAVSLWVNQEGPLFTKGVRSPMKKEVLEKVHQDFSEQLAEQGIEEQRTAISLQDMQQALEAGWIPLILMSSWRMSRSKSPHWVVVTALDAQFVYIHDPEIDEEDQKSCLDTQQVPITHLEFERMACFGQEKLRACVLVGPVRAA